MSKTEIDPYYSVRDHVQNQIDKINTKYAKFQDLVRNTDTSTNSEFKELRKNLVKDVRAADKELKGVKEAVETIDKNRSKFIHIKDAELANRKRFVEQSQESINAVKRGMESPDVRKKIEEDELRRGRDSYDETNSILAKQATEENSRFIQNEKLRQQQIIKQQDQDLEQLGNAVDKLHNIGKEINTEIKEQEILLDNLDNEINDASSRMDTVMAALQKLLKTKDSCQIWTIVILAIILVILVALVIWA